MESPVLVQDLLMQGRPQQLGCQPAACMVASNSLDTCKNLDASNSQQHSVSIVSPPIVRNLLRVNSSTIVNWSHPPYRVLSRG
jgi:hypothetical protein